MAYIKKFDGQTDTTVQLGDKNNPVRKSVEGYFLGTKETPDTGYGPGKLHIFQTKEGTVGVWGKTNSNRLMTSDHRGQMCKLTFTGMGEKKKGKNPAYNYELQYDAENTTDVTGVDMNASEPEEDLGSDEVEGSSFAEEPSESEESSPDEITVARAKPPLSKPAPVSASSRDRVNALLSRRSS